jgi:hypothetical protein
MLGDDSFEIESTHSFEQSDTFCGDVIDVNQRIASPNQQPTKFLLPINEWRRRQIVTVTGRPVSSTHTISPPRRAD